VRNIWKLKYCSR